MGRFGRMQLVQEELSLGVIVISAIGWVGM